MKHNLSVYLLGLLVVAGGCHSSHGKTDAGTPVDAGPTPSSLDITPSTVTVEVANGVAATTAFHATAHYADGHTADVTSTATWTLVDPGLGVISAGAFTSGTKRGGKTTVQVVDGSSTASAELAVKWTTTRSSTDDGSSAPANAATLFAGATTADATLAPAIAYPLDGVVMPVNLGELEVQWSKPTGAADLFEVAFTSDLIDLRLYTNAPETSGGRLSLLAAEWAAIAQTVAGGTVAVKVTGLTSSDPTKSGAATPVKVQIDAVPVNGGIYYWTPTNQGVERHQFGDTMGLATNFYSTTNTGGHCVACHTISRDGTKAAVTFDSGAAGNSALLDVATTTQTVSNSVGLLFDFATFSPDGNKLISPFATGALRVIDTSSGPTAGTVLGTLDLGAGHYASHPDWSPDGKSLVYSMVPSPPGSDFDLSQASIALISGPGDGTFSNAQTIVAQTGTENDYYPSFSPDGKWILFNRVPSGSSYNNPAAELWVVSSDGKVGPIQLANANATGALTNSWPRWSPFVQMEADGTQRYYFTFSSTRNYGIELLQSTLPGPRPQIWMSAFSPSIAQTGSDPSSVPFWLPFQDLTTNNHIAQWTQTIVTTL